MIDFSDCGTSVGVFLSQFVNYSMCTSCHGLGNLYADDGTVNECAACSGTGLVVSSAIGFIRKSENDK